MNALAEPPTRLQRYEAALKAFVPMDEPQPVRMERYHLMAFRDIATRAISNPRAHCDKALTLYSLANQIASENAYRFDGLADLERYSSTVGKLIGCASTLDTLEHGA